MKTGFEGLDKIINIEEPQLILFTGHPFVDMLSGDIANNICLKKEGNQVLQIIGHDKEKIFKRMLISQANVDSKKWNKNTYTDMELQQIGRATVDLINTERTLPSIIQQNLFLNDLKNVTKVVLNFANHYAGMKGINHLVILDLYQLEWVKCGKLHKEGKEILKFIREMKRISSESKCPIILVYDNMNFNKICCEEDYTQKEDVSYIDKLNEYVDKTVILNMIKKDSLQEMDLFDVCVYDKERLVGNCKLVYDLKYRKFVNYKQIRRDKSFYKYMTKQSKNLK